MLLPPARRPRATLPDPGRRIDPESARAAARNMPGVRSVVWLDHGNLLVRVDGMAYRTHQVIDEVC